MKTCPICKARAFDDAQVCYGCLHRFAEGEDELEEPRFGEDSLLRRNVPAVTRGEIARPGKASGVAAARGQVDWSVPASSASVAAGVVPGSGMPLASGGPWQVRFEVTPTAPAATSAHDGGEEADEQEERRDASAWPFSVAVSVIPYFAEGPSGKADDLRACANAASGDGA